jgi:hypothetical protein
MISNRFELTVNISISMIPKGFIWAFRNGFAPVKIFYASIIPKSPIYNGNGDASEFIYILMLVGTGWLE